jgi:Tfp pilus assembly protein FimT
MRIRGERGVTLIELGAVLALLAVGVGLAAPAVGALGRVTETFRANGAAGDLYAAVHATRARARATGVMHALVIERDGHAFRIVENPGRQARTVVGPHALVDGVVSSGNTTIRFSPKGFAVPFGTLTVRAGGEVRRVIINILGRVRIATGEPPR